MKNTTLKTAAAGCLLALTAADALAQEVISGGVKDYAELGTAYNSLTGEFINTQPLMGKKTFAELKGAEVISRTDMNYQSVASLVNGELSVQADFPVIKASAGAEIALASSFDRFSNNWVLSIINQSGKEVLRNFNGVGNPPLSSYGQDIANAANAGTIDDNELLARVGDSYISEITYGSHLFVTMKAEFLNEAEKLDFAGKINVSFTAGSVNGNLSSFSEEKKAAVKITVRAHQFGGDPARLLTIIPDNILQCDLNNFDPCANLFAKAIRYAQGVGEYTGTGFKNEDNESEPLATSNVINYQTQTYYQNTSTIPFRRNYSTTDHSQRIDVLEERYIEEMEAGQRASSLLSNSQSYLTSYQTASLRNVRDTALQNAEAIRDLVEHCESSPYSSSCGNDCKVGNDIFGCLDVYNTDIFSLNTLSEIEQSINQYSRLMIGSTPDKMAVDLFKGPGTTAGPKNGGGLSVNKTTGRITGNEGIVISGYDNDGSTTTEFLVKVNRRLPRAAIWPQGTYDFFQVSAYAGDQWQVVQENGFSLDQTVLDGTQNYGGFYYYRVIMKNVYKPILDFSGWTTGLNYDLYFYTDDVKTMPMTTGLKVPSTPLYFTAENITVDRDVSGNQIGYCASNSGSLTRSMTDRCYDNGRLYSKADAIKACAKFNELHSASTGLFWSLPTMDDFNLLIERVEQDSGANNAGYWLKSFNYSQYNGTDRSNDHFGFSYRPSGYATSSGSTQSGSGTMGFLWANSSSGNDTLYMSYSNNNVYRYNYSDGYRFGARCVGTYNQR